MSVGPGTILGSYELIGLIARGGMGEVYRARHRRLTDREVAIKVMPAVLAADPSFLQRFEREANNIAALSHQHILPLWEYGDQHGLPYIVMPLVVGGSLRDRMRGQRMTSGEVLGIIRPIADALDYAHSRGIIHRDIKPANILLDERGHLYVADFGIAKATQAGVEALTRTGVGVGTPEYMAPEQTQGLADPRSDVYALGIIAYEALTGHVPYKGQTPVDVAIKHATVPMPPLSDHGAIASPTLDAVVRKALAKTPHERYASAGAFVNDFAAALAGADSPTVSVQSAVRPPQPPPPASTPPPTPTWPTPTPGPTGPTGQIPAAAGAGTAGPTRSTWRIVAITLAVGLVLGLAVAIGGIALLNARENPQTIGRGATASTPSPGASAAIPFTFPIDNALFAKKYEEARGMLPAEARADARLNVVGVECFDPRANADCTIGYQFYSRATDFKYGFVFSVFDTKPVEQQAEKVEGDYDRIVFLKVPWEHNPAWAKLLADGFAQVPTSNREHAFSVELMSFAAELNEGNYDWSAKFIDKVTSESIGFLLSGTRITKES